MKQKLRPLFTVTKERWKDEWGQGTKRELIYSGRNEVKWKGFKENETMLWECEAVFFGLPQSSQKELLLAHKTTNEWPKKCPYP